MSDVQPIHADEETEWKSIRVKPATHRKFKELAAKRGESIDEVAGDLADAALKPSEAQAVPPSVGESAMTNG